MNPTTRPPQPKLLLVHNGSGFEDHIRHLTDAGLRVSSTHAETAVADATTIQPDIVVLDFGCDGDVTRELKGHPQTRHIPVIALVDLMPGE